MESLTKYLEFLYDVNVILVLEFLDFETLKRFESEVTGPLKQRARHLMTQMTANADINNYRHTKASFDWLLSRGIRATKLIFQASTNRGEIFDTVLVLPNSLRDLFVCGFRDLTAPRLNKVFNDCPNITFINMLGCRNFTLTGVNFPPGLREIDLSFCRNDADITTEGIINLANFCHNLESISLNCRAAHDINDTAIQRICTNCRGLREINLGFNDVISDIALNSLATLNNITWLDLGQSPHITDIGIRNVVTANPELRILAIGDCRNLNDRCLRVIAESCSRLRIIRFDSRCEHISDVGFQSLVEANSNLEHIAIDESQITDRSLTAIANCCHQLESISMVQCQNITTDGVNTLVERHITGNRLEIQLSLHNNRGITKSYLEQIMASHPGLRIVDYPDGFDDDENDDQF